jgi:hypothetical protein
MTVNAWNDDAPSTLPRRPRALSWVSTGLGTILFLVVVALLAFPANAADGSKRSRPESPDGREQILGLVENGRVRVVFPDIGSPLGLRLTTIQRQEARSVESGEVDLTAYEGDAILIEGIRDSGWIYEARIVDHAGPILTLLVRRAFEKKSP